MRSKRFYLIAFLVLSLLIFYFSSQDIHRSRDFSLKIAQGVMDFFRLDLDLDHMDFLVRKSGHFLAYFFLGIFIYRILDKRGLERKKTLGYGILILILLASLDEFHQLFVAGRQASIKDIILDSFAGFLAGLIFYFKDIGH